MPEQELQGVIVLGEKWQSLQAGGEEVTRLLTQMSVARPLFAVLQHSRHFLMRQVGR